MIDINNTTFVGLGKRIRALRRSKKLTLEELSLLANVCLGSVQAVETSRSKNPSVHIIKSIADVLGTTIDDLLQPEDIYNNDDLAKDIYHMLIYLKNTQIHNPHFIPLTEYERKIYSLSKAWALEAAQVTMKSLPKTVAIKALQDWLEKTDD